MIVIRKKCSNVLFYTVYFVLSIEFSLLLLSICNETRMFALQEVVAWIIHYGYAVMLPIAIVEGPIVTIIGAFLAAHGLLNVYLVYLVSLAGDMLGDLLYYAIGRWGRNSFLMGWIRFFGVNEKRIEKLEKHFEKHSGKTLVVGKITHGVGSIVLLAAGAAKMPLWRFMWVNFVASLPKSLLFVLIGYFFGAAYVKIGVYLDNTAKATVIAAIALVVIYFIIVKIAKRYGNGNQE